MNDKICYKACDKSKIDAGLCDCTNLIQLQKLVENDIKDLDDEDDTEYIDQDDDDDDDSDECCDTCGCYHGHHSWCADK